MSEEKNKRRIPVRISGLDQATGSAALGAQMKGLKSMSKAVGLSRIAAPHLSQPRVDVSKVLEQMDRERAALRVAPLATKSAAARTNEHLVNLTEAISALAIVQRATDKKTAWLVMLTLVVIVLTAAIAGLTLLLVLR